MDAIEQWRESIPKESRVEAGAGAALAGAGLLAGILMFLSGRRGLLAWVIPSALLGAGTIVLAHALLSVRNDRIAESQIAIEAHLASLDPIARARVLKNVGESQLRALLPRRTVS